MNAVAFGMDGIPLEAVTQEPYMMEGAFDAAAFASGNYVLAVGPAIEQVRFIRLSRRRLWEVR